MLSLPEDWEYIPSGLAYINHEKIDIIRQAIKEFESEGKTAGRAKSNVIDYNKNSDR